MDNELTENETEVSRFIYEARLKERRDQNSRERLAFDNGFKEGFKEGFEEGLERVRIAKNLIALNSDSQFIAKATKLTVEQVEQIRAKTAD